MRNSAMRDFNLDLPCRERGSFNNIRTAGK